MNVEFYRKYKLQNPVKYKLKFGDKLPEELAGQPQAPTVPFLTGNVKVEIQEKPEVELEFKQPEAPKPEPQKPEPEYPTEIKKPAKRKSKKVTRPEDLNRNLA